MGGQMVACLATLNHPESRGETGDRFISNTVLSLVTRELKGCENVRPEMRPIALRIVYRATDNRDHATKTDPDHFVSPSSPAQQTTRAKDIRGGPATPLRPTMHRDPHDC
jgi:hypothetical protein